MATTVTIPEGFEVERTGGDAPPIPEGFEVERASLSAANLSWRERLARILMGDARPHETRGRLVQGFLGTTGGGPTRFSMADLVPPIAAAFAGNETNRAAERGHYGDAALSALAAIPAPGVGGAVRTAGREVVRGGALTAENRLALPPPREPPPASAAPDVIPLSAPERPPPVEVPPAGPQTASGTPPPAPAGRAWSPPGGSPGPSGASTAHEIVTPDGSMTIRARPELVELSDLRLAEGRFQPRDRTRLEYQQEARERATRLDPAQLMPGRVSDAGAPIVLPDGTVISGNGRVMSISEVYSGRYTSDQARAYRASLGPQAEGMREPILIMRAEPMSADDAVRFADLSNRTRIAQMSATERAARDAQALGPDGLSLFQGGDFTSAGNATFLHAFSERAVTAAERPAFSSGAALTQEGVNRMRAAVLHGAYGDSQLIARMIESTDDNIRNITGALTDAAPGFVGMRAEIRNGAVMAELDPTPQLTEAVRLIADLRSRGVRPDQFFAQTDAFSNRHPLVEAFVRGFYNDQLTRPISRQKMTELLNAYTAEARKHAAGGGLFADPTTAGDVLNVAIRARGPDPQPAPDLLTATGAVGARVPASGPGASGPAAFGVGAFAPAGGASLWPGGQPDSDLTLRRRLIDRLLAAQNGG